MGSSNQVNVRRQCRRRSGNRRSYLPAEPGCALRRCISASAPAGLTEAIADCNLFFQPLTMSPSPRIIAAKPIFATSTGSSLSCRPIFVSSISARSKNSVSVAPGIRDVTVIPISFNSLRNAKENESINALLALYTALNAPGTKPAIEPVMRSFR